MRNIILLLIVIQVAVGSTKFRSSKTPQINSPLRSDVPPQYWRNCQAEICDEMKDQTEGLVRLKLMRRYLTETMNMMTQLITSMDAEIVESGNKLADFVGPHCPDMNILLQGLTKHSLSDIQTARNAGLTTAMSLGVEEFDDNSKEIDDHDDKPLSGHGNLQNPKSGKQLGVKSHSNDPQHQQYVPPGYPTNKPEFNDYQSREEFDDKFHSSDEITNKNSWGTNTNLNNRDQHTNYHQRSTHTHHTQPQGTNQNQPQGNQNQPYGNQNQPHGSQNQPQGNQNQPQGNQNQPYNKSKSRGSSKTYYSKKQGDLHSSSSGTVITFDRKVCHGVPPTSPHWVPGLDGWCKINCSQGYCPETHCFCL